MAKKFATTSDDLRYRPSFEDTPPRSIAPSITARTLTLVLLTFVALYFLLPIVWLIIGSTKNNTDLVRTFGLAFGEFNCSSSWRRGTTSCCR